MPTMVETIRDLCKKKKIAISRLEKDLNYGNGYLNPKKATTVDSKRLKEIADYLDVPIEMLYGENEEKPATQGNELFEKFSKLSAKDQALVRSTMRLMIEQLLNAQSEQ